MNNSYHTKNGRTSKRGAFINGVWHCDCETRLPAEKFQTKNGGKNHGRWFYTCQKPQPKRCAFFLWSDDAKVREESAVINNSRSEQEVAPIQPQTPKKQTKLDQPLTPFSRARSTTISPEIPRQRLWPSAKIDEDEQTFDWSSSGDEELASVAEAVLKGSEESPTKSARTALSDSPSKRSYTEMNRSSKSELTKNQEGEGFRTPTTSTKLTGLPSPSDSHAKMSRDLSIVQFSSNLTSEVLELLKLANLSSQVEQELVELLNRHELRSQGIARGRDITRLAVQSKDKKIAELQARIIALEAEKETSRTVIAHLKQDIATSPKRVGRVRFGSRSEV